MENQDTKEFLQQVEFDFKRGLIQQEVYNYIKMTMGAEEDENNAN